MKIVGEQFSEQVVEYILSRSINQLKEISVDSIADHFNITKMTLITKFRKQKGITPGKFITRERIYRALLLMTTNRQLTIEKVSKKMGFSTCDYFIQLFKKQFGTSPGKYRDAIKKMIEGYNIHF